MHLLNLGVSFGFLIGAILGSFIKAIADRSINNRLFTGRSYCEACKRKLSWYDLLPIISYISLLGKCRYCQKKISYSVFLTELLMGALIALLFFQKIPTDFLALFLTKQSLILSEVIFQVFIIAVLVTVFITDIKKGLIPDRITYPSILIALIYLIVSSFYKIFLIFKATINSALGKFLLPPYSDYFLRHAYFSASPLFLGILSSLGLFLFFWALIFITKGKGMGGGDLKLGVFIGLCYGFPNSILVLMLAFLTGSLVGIFLLSTGRKKVGQTIPFGPFLSLGGIITIFWSDKILNWYLNLRVF